VGFPKPKRFVCNSFLIWVREHACFICHSVNVDAHHTRTKGSGGDDTTAVPLCRKHHQEWHAIGNLAFQKQYQFLMAEIRVELLEGFIKERREIFAREPGKASN